MCRILTLLLFVINLASCDKLSEMHFKNSDETSGGFLDVQLDLNADKTITLHVLSRKLLVRMKRGQVMSQSCIRLPALGQFRKISCIATLMIHQSL